MEHRFGTRRPLSLPVRLDKRGETLAFGRMLNVSLSGAYIETTRIFQPLMQIEIYCGRFSGDPARASGIAAYMARKTITGVGVEWCEFAPAAIRRLMALVESSVLGSVCVDSGGRSQTIARGDTP